MHSDRIRLSESAISARRIFVKEENMSKVNKVVLAYSGGLDTSVMQDGCVKPTTARWLLLPQILVKEKK